MSQMTIEQLANMAAETEDQTETTASQDFEYTPPPAGITVGRLIEYIELGKHGQKPYQGKPKPDADIVTLVFELLHPTKNIKDVETENGTIKVADQVRVTLSKKLGEKARFKKLFNALTYGRADKRHIAQMLGEAFIIEVIHNKVTKDGKEITYVNIEDDAGWKINAPFKIDPLENTKVALNVPANIKPLKIFLWDHPTQETWDSLFIDGHREVKEGDTVHQVSKNWLQERIMSAKNYAGSPLQIMQNKVTDLPVTEDKKQGNASGTASGTSVPAGKTNGTSTTASPSEQVLEELPAVEPTKPATVTSAVDDLASLGL